jgi:hypothetical protein
MARHSPLAIDAKNRATRVAIQGLFIDLCVTVVLILWTAFAQAGGWSDLQWALIGFTIAKTVVQSIASYVMRRYLDPSRVPTPLPPDPQAQPAQVK